MATWVSDKEDPSMYFVFCMTTPISLSWFYNYWYHFHRSGVFSAITRALLTSALTPFSETPSNPRTTKALFSAIWHTLGSIVQWHPPTSLQVPCSLQHPSLVWLTCCLKKKWIFLNKLLPDSSTNPALPSVLHITLWLLVKMTSC